MKTSNLTLCCLFALLFSCEPQTPLQDAQKEKMPSNNIRNYLTGQAAAITESALQNIESKEDWQQIRDDRYAEMVQMLSLKDMPLQGQRSPLNVKKTGTIQMEGYRIEKLYYESIPGLYVPANLYIPDHITDPRPAILYQCGHARSQKVHYQPHPHRYAQLGFVCLIVETVQYGEVFGEHWGCYARGWFNWYSRGYTPAGVETWNGIRGLDLLSELPEVDPERLGVTGISGGGALTWYIAAMDPRIKAAATVCGNSTLEAQICTRTIDGHCDCMMFINTYSRDFHDLGALIAPRPLFIAQADRDGLNTIESATEVYESLRNFYGLFGAEGNIDFISTPGGHSYHPNSRKAIFSFFMQHLMNKNIPPEDIADVPAEDLLSEDDLRVYVDGPPVDDITTTIQDSFILKPIPPDFTSIAELEVYRVEIKRLLKERTFQAFPKDDIPFGEKMEFRTLDRAAFGSEIFGFNTETDWRLKLDIRYRSQRNGKKPLMIVLRNPGEQRWDSEAFISGLNEDWNVAFVELRGIGETGWAPELQWHVRRASAWSGRTIASMRVYDLLRTIEFARGLPDVDAGQIGIAARGEMAAIALYAALLDGKCKTLILQNPLPTQDLAGNPDGRGDALEMLNCLQITDVYQLPALVYPASTCFIGGVPDNYKWSVKSLEALNLTHHIKVVEDLTAFR